MEYRDITITFTLSESEYRQYSKNIDRAMDLILPYGKNYEIYENEYDEEE